jgi:hypothetical protein
MRKFLIPGMLALLCAACSNDDFPSDDSATQSQFAASEGDRYLAVQLLAPNDATTSRAAQPADNDFDDGLAEESAVDDSNIVFYFFDENGDPFAIDGTDTGANRSTALTGASYPSTLPDDAKTSSTVTWTDDTERSYITKVSSAIVLLHNPKGVPAQVVAVLNGNITATRLTLSQLAQTVVTKGYTEAASTTSAPTNFMMTNTVYKDGDNVLIQASKVSVTNICNTADAASLNPMEIYVERVVSKVGVNIDTDKTVDGTDNVFLLTGELGECPGRYSETGTPDGATIADSEKQLYVKFTGWTTFDEAPSTVALKDITGTYGGIATDYTGTTYDPTTDGSFAWNAADKYRSYWAYAYFKAANINKKEVKFDEISLPFGDGAGHFSYPFENTSGVVSSADGLATKVILAAQICTKNATTGEYEPYSMCKFMGVTRSLATMKSYITNLLRQEGLHVDVKGTVEDITDDDWVFAYQNASPKVDCTYKVRIQGKGDKQLREGNGAYCDKDGKEIDSKKIFESLPLAQLWENGKCYYYTYIQHLNQKNAIVRNHWYTVTINSVTGFGTPHANPEGKENPGGGGDEGEGGDDDGEDEYEFDPTRPDDDEWILGAKINIEAWRMVGTVADLSSTYTTDDKNEEAASTAP